MKISLSSLIVRDQTEALRFYTQVLGFEQKHDIPAGKYRWITVVSPELPTGTELTLEPAASDAAKTYQAALYAAGTPLTAFETTDIAAEYQRLLALGVTFKSAPTVLPDITMAIFDDTVGNWIAVYQPKPHILAV